VKGEAIEASPRRTSCGSIDASSSFFMRSRNFFWQRRKGVGEEKGEWERGGRGEGEERGGGGVREGREKREEEEEWERRKGEWERRRTGVGKKSHDMTVYIHCSIT